MDVKDILAQKMGGAKIGTASTTDALTNMNVGKQDLQPNTNAGSPEEVKKVLTMQEKIALAKLQSGNRPGVVTSSDPNKMVGALEAREYEKNYLPKEPAEGEVVFRSNFNHQQFFMPNGKQLLVVNHFITLSDEDEIKEVEFIANSTGTLKEYNGPWAKEENKEAE